MIVLLGWTLIEVVPRYGVERHRHQGAGRLDHPTFLIGDCLYYRATLVSLLDDRDLDVQNNLAAQRYPMACNVARGRRGEFYPKHPILLAVVALPFYVVAGDIGLLAFNLAQLCALVLVMWLGARRYAGDLIAFALMLWFAFGTMLRPAAYNFAPDVLSSLLVVGAHRRGCCTGAASSPACCSGCPSWAKWTNAIFFPVAAVALAMRRDWRSLCRFGAAAALPASPACSGSTAHMFGSPLVTPYDRVLIVEKLRWVARALAPLLLHRAVLARPVDAVDRPPRGPGVGRAAVRARVARLRTSCTASARSDALLVGAACVAQLVMFAKYEQWNVGSYGPRFLLSVVALSALPAAATLAFVLQRARRRRVDVAP